VTSCNDNDLMVYLRIKRTKSSLRLCVGWRQSGKSVLLLVKNKYFPSVLGKYKYRFFLFAMSTETYLTFLQVFLSLLSLIYIKFCVGIEWIFIICENSSELKVFFLLFKWFSIIYCLFICSYRKKKQNLFAR
jgi:hypothetical protein